MRKKYFIGMVVGLLLTGIALSGCGNEGVDVAGKNSNISSELVEKDNKQTDPMKVPSEDGSQNLATEQTNRDGQNGQEKESVAGETTMALTDSGISPDAAKDIALSDADVSEQDVSGMRVKREYDDGRDVYKVEFYIQNKEYDYEIDAYTKDIISVDFDVDNDFYYPGASQEAPTGIGQGVISLEEATSLVLEKVPGATQENIRIKLEWDDGRQLYEGDVYFNQKEYEFEMDAHTGNFLEWSEESIYH